MQNRTCYCNNKKNYDECCFPYLSNTRTPQTPEQLMRSRYSAFCTKNIKYLVATHYPLKREEKEEEILEETINNTQWHGLKVLETEKDKKDSNIEYVEFTAFYQTNNGHGQLHEKSKFIYENDRWYYVDGFLLEPIKIGRNEPCWCQSNKKFKKCHGKF
ncbi:MAG: YchJ family protein [Desulfamplus sp.]|nr:YchJ family protein [Desulfamplus sp.]